MLITGGCGISQITWPEWPTWPKYCKVVFDCDHINLGAPAAGNWYILNSILKSIQENLSTVECVIVTWTNHEKLDLFVDNSNPIDDIRNFNSRNWILNWQGELTNQSSGFWPSSVSTDNYFKKSYQPWQNKTQHALTTFHCILQLQNYCKIKNIPLYNFMSYDLELEKYKRNKDTAWLVNSIDWESWPTTQPLVHDYQNGDWFSYEITKQQGLIPVAGWHWEIFVEKIIPIMEKHFNKKNINLKKIQDNVIQLTKKKYNEYKNIMETKK